MAVDGRKRELHPKRALDRIGVADLVLAAEADAVRVVPEQPFLAMGQLQVDLDMALRQRDRSLIHDGPRPGPRDDLAVTLAVAHLFGDLPRALDPHTRGDLTMLAAPELRDLLAQP